MSRTSSSGRRGSRARWPTGGTGTARAGPPGSAGGPDAADACLSGAPAAAAAGAASGTGAAAPAPRRPDHRARATSWAPGTPSVRQAARRGAERARPTVAVDLVCGHCPAARRCAAAARSAPPPSAARRPRSPRPASRAAATVCSASAAAIARSSAASRRASVSWRAQSRDRFRAALVHRDGEVLLHHGAAVLGVGPCARAAGLGLRLGRRDSGLGGCPALRQLGVHPFLLTGDLRADPLGLGDGGRAQGGGLDLGSVADLGRLLVRCGPHPLDLGQHLLAFGGDGRRRGLVLGGRLPLLGELGAGAAMPGDRLVQSDWVALRKPSASTRAASMIPRAACSASAIRRSACDCAAASISSTSSSASRSIERIRSLMCCTRGAAGLVRCCRLRPQPLRPGPRASSSRCMLCGLVDRGVPVGGRILISASSRRSARRPAPGRNPAGRSRSRPRRTARGICGHGNYRTGPRRAVSSCPHAW